MHDFSVRLADLPWEERGVDAVLATQPKDVVQYVQNELLLCPLDFRYWATRYYWVADEHSQMVRFRFRRSQEKLLARFAALEESDYPLRRGKIALLLVKARRVGATAVGQGMLAHGYLRYQAKALTGGDIPQSTTELNHIQNRLMSNLPGWMRPKIGGKTKIGHTFFPDLDSELTYVLGDAKNPVQGVRLDYIHLTEVPTWLSIRTITDNLWPAFRSSHVPTSFMFLEGTAKSDCDSGLHYQRMFKKAQEEQGVFRALFIPWYDVDLHSSPTGGVTLRPTTLAVAERIKRDTGFEVSKEQLAWYETERSQFEAEHRLYEFFQEYPTNVEDSWQSGFNSAISVEAQDKAKQAAKAPVMVLKWDAGRVSFNDVTGKWKVDDSPLQHAFIYEPPQRGATYVVGVDGSHGDPEYDSEDWTKGERDPSAVEVLKVATPGSKPEQVASFMGYVHPQDELPFIAEKFGKMYVDATNDSYPAMMACEVNAGSPSALTQMELLKRGYPHFYVWPKPNKVGGGYSSSIGWETTPKSRPWITAGLIKDIEDGTLIINSPVTLEQMKTFVRTRSLSGQVRLDHAPGYHDDSLFALGIALFCSQDQSAVTLATEAWKAADKPRDAKPAADLQATGMRFIPGEGWQVVTAALARGQEDDPDYPLLFGQADPFD